LSEVKSELKAD